MRFLCRLVLAISYLYIKNISIAILLCYFVDRKHIKPKLVVYYMVAVLNIDMTRVRKTRTFRLDEIVIDGLNELAKKKNTSANRLLENTLFELLRNESIITDDIEPLGETRGGDQKSEKVIDND